MNDSDYLTGSDKTINPGFQYMHSIDLFLL